MTTDISTQLLAMLFGSVGDSLAGPPTAIGELLFYINIIGIQAITIVVAYSSVVGTIATAHDGELLGKKWSSAWVPIRFASGSVALIPSAGGTATIHVFLIWLTLQGVGFANDAWSAAQRWFVGTGSVAQAIVPDTYPIAQAVLRSHVCMIGLRIAASTFGGNADAIGATWDSTGTRLQFGGGDYGSAACGGLDMPGAIKLKTQFADMPGVSHIDVGPLISAHHAAALQLVSEIDATVARSIKTISDPVSGTLEAQAPDWNSISTTLRASAEKYAGAIQVAAAKQADLQRRQKIAADANADGWALAGAYWWRMAADATRTQAAINALPTPLPMTAAANMPAILKSTFDGLMAGVDALIQRTQPAASETVAPEAEGGGIWGWVKAQASRPIAGLVDAAARTFDDPQVNPLLAIKHLGDNVLISAETLAGAAIVGSFAGVTATASQFVLYTIALPLMMLGIGLAVVIPLLPAVRWFSAVLQWMIFVLESMIGAVFWVVGVAHPEGEGISGDHGRAGWKILANLTLRPLLLVAGLVAFAGVLQAGAFLLARVMPAMTSAMAGSGFVGVFVGLGLLLVMFGLLFKVVGMAAGLPDHFAETALSWIEAGGGAAGSKLAAAVAPLPGGGRMSGGAGGGGIPKPGAGKTPKTTPDAVPGATAEKNFSTAPAIPAPTKGE